MINFSTLSSDAHAAGHKAATDTVPDPMHVSGFGPVSEGICGFGKITFAGNTAWGRYAKKFLGARNNYGGGLYLWVSDYGQSYERKRAYARAYAEVLTAAGIKANGYGIVD